MILLRIGFFSSCNLAKSDNLFLFAFFLWFFLWFFSLSHRVYVACFVDFSFSLYFYFLSRLNLVHLWIPYEINHNVEFAIKLSSHTRWLDLSRHYFQTKPVYCSVIDENFDDGKSCTNFFFRFRIANLSDFLLSSFDFFFPLFPYTKNQFSVKRHTKTEMQNAKKTEKGSTMSVGVCTFVLIFSISFSAILFLLFVCVLI